jgi:phosphatidate phosphatase APP1
MSSDLSWKGHFVRIADHVERGVDAVKYRLSDRFDRDDPLQVLPYRGYGTRERLFLAGRVLEDEPIAVSKADDSLWKNLANTWKRIESDEVPFARLRARFRGWEAELTADEEGYVRHVIDLAEPLPAEGGWHEVELELLHPRDPAGRPVRAAAPVFVPSASAEYGVISDLDDTVVESNVTDRLAAARTVLLGNSRTRLPFAGVAAFYQALHAGASGRSGNPVFYVSSSPWNLYDVITGFLEAQEIPAGPLLLRDWDLSPSLLRNEAHKAAHLGEILGTYPRLPFILVGDSTQEDPEIYASAVAAHPDRILAVYIRSVEPHPEREAAIQRLAKEVKAAGSTLVLADDTLTIASHAAAHGWIRGEALAQVGGEKRADEGAGGKADAPGVPLHPSAPTVVVDPDLGAGDLA